MSSKKNPCIKDVELKVLEITETPNEVEAQPVAVELTKGDKVGSMTNSSSQAISIFQGEMTYQRPGKKKVKKVDMVEAIFVADKGKVTDSGNIVLKVNLTEGNTFVSPLGH